MPTQFQLSLGDLIIKKYDVLEIFSDTFAPMNTLNYFL